VQQGKFQAFYQYAKTFNADEFDYEELKNSDFIFMRWKVSISGETICIHNPNTLSPGHNMYSVTICTEEEEEEELDGQTRLYSHTTHTDR